MGSKTSLHAHGIILRCLLGTRRGGDHASRVQKKGYNPLRLGVGHHPTNSLHVGGIHQSALAQTHLALGILLGEDVAQVLSATFELAGASGGKPLGGTTSGLHLRHGQLLT